jgi:hypothetical protein
MLGEEKKFDLVEHAKLEAFSRGQSGSRKENFYMIRISETRLTSVVSARAVAFQLMLVNGAFGQSSTWLATTNGGLWSDAANWSSGVPNSPTATAIFNAEEGKAYQVNIPKTKPPAPPISFTVGTLDLNGDVGGGPILNTTFGH